jgi:beta-lactamase superfamily II metal-dependent hydrolase
MSVTVRMYDVGFGDCFLVSGGLERRWRMLIDCGCHLSSSPSGGGSISAAARALIEDCRDPDGVARIDVVVVSHRHYDHIAGFDLDDWHKVEVGAVLLPWTEDPQDPEARRIHDAQLRLAARLEALAAASGTGAAAARELLELSNAGAMKMVHEGFAGSYQPPRFLAGDKDAPPIALDALPGVRIHVLGPARDEATIRNLDPPAGQSYLALDSRTGDGEEPIRPFSALMGVTAGPGRDRSLLALENAIKDDILDIAASLNDSVNGTSLVLVVEVGEARLLFTGDAQWGTWDRILGHDPWRELLAGINFLKVGHHGSHNASPKRLVEDVLPDGIVAMVSVRPVKRWKQIPRQPLLDRLRQKSIAIIRSDLGPDAARPDVRRGPDDRYWELELPT